MVEMEIGAVTMENSMEVPYKTEKLDFPGSLVVKPLCFHCREKTKIRVTI